MAQSSIEWTDAVWNPVTGCSKVSPGCKHCYAERMAKRLAGRDGYPADEPFRVTLHPEKLDLPLRWRKPRRIFVNSMSDLFHEMVMDSFIDKVFAVMALAPRHTFQILTKRPERMLSYLSAAGVSKRVDDAALAIATKWDFDRTAPGKPLPTEFLLGRANELPLPNVWLGTSVENQQTADERIPLLLQTPAAVRFISAEPLLGAVDLGELTWVSLPRGVRGDSPFQSTFAAAGIRRAHTNRFGAMSAIAEAGEWLGIKPAEMDWCRKLDWVIVGGESGPGARTMHPDWARRIRDACKAAGVPFLFKQHGEWLPADEHMRGMWPERANGKVIARDWWPRHDWEDGLSSYRVGKRRAGRLLDGVLHDEYPEVR